MIVVVSTIVGNAGIDFTDNIGRSWRHHKKIGSFGQADVGHIIRDIAIKGVNNALIAG